ncbi:MAG: helix-turn-helix transcriptional regulator [Pseudoxanthomonas sp.]|nr:helix-turn-helix transcriptional regulator [Pseudoxanthomonas sp.]
MNPQLAGGTEGDNLGRRFRESREHAGLTQQAAAKSIGLSAGQLGRIERGGVSMVAEPGTIVRAARIYGVPQAWLYAGAMAAARLVPAWYSLQPEARAAA